MKPQGYEGGTVMTGVVDGATALLRFKLADQKRIERLGSELRRRERGHWGLEASEHLLDMMHASKHPKTRAALLAVSAEYYAEAQADILGSGN